jgi:two-component system nitrogen regulation response regulator GlnG
VQSAQLAAPAVDLQSVASLVPPAISQVAPGPFADGGVVIPVPVSDGGFAPWEKSLADETFELLLAGQPEVWDVLTRRFESRLIQAALLVTKGRRIEAAQRLGIGRNTITRKIQELGLE